ncbi:hypothetical protein [Pseudomonas helleri]|uniref:hypothetical protein n=1 Tax=Pseudomonas helleri TaxID=1608996 RepID=UPI0012976ACB|nr:hypothetical protein [Pseudomonas helleri]MQT39108.1 hypothetical protein [Pseudomonas helleri]MQU61108.1 hypothetical protein [Pseudomonas helleri]
MKPPSIPLSDFWQAILAPSRSDLLFALRNIIAGAVALYRKRSINPTDFNGALS